MVNRDGERFLRLFFGLLPLPRLAGFTGDRLARVLRRIGFLIGERLPARRLRGDRERLFESPRLSEESEELLDRALERDLDLDRDPPPSSSPAPFDRDRFCFVGSRPYLSGRCFRSAITFRTS